jgi:hypothetical protein
MVINTERMININPSSKPNFFFKIQEKIIGNTKYNDKYIIKIDKKNIFKKLFASE